jgi:hypothetical protein
MSDTPAIDPHKAKALELANIAGGSHAEVIARATAYHGFLTGTAAPKAAAATTAAPKTGGATTTAPKATPAAGAAQTSKPGAAAPKTTPAAGTAPKAAATAAAPKGATTAPKAAAAKPGAAAPMPPGDTKDPNGTHTFSDVSAALQSVVNSGLNPKASKEDQAAARDTGKAAAYVILDKTGGGAKSVRDVKPALYDKVVKPAAAPAAQEAADDFGAPADPPVTDDDSVVDSDPPEQTGAGQDAEDM